MKKRGWNHAKKCILSFLIIYLLFFVGCGGGSGSNGGAGGGDICTDECPDCYDLMSYCFALSGPPADLCHAEIDMCINNSANEHCCNQYNVCCKKLLDSKKGK